MQVAKASQIMLPCGRRVYLHKSTSFKKIRTISEPFLTNKRIDAKVNHNMIEQSI